MSKAKPAQLPPPFTLRGPFIRFTFIREYKKTGATEIDAETYFGRCLDTGSIVFLRESGWGDKVNVYEFVKAMT